MPLDNLNQPGLPPIANRPLAANNGQAPAPAAAPQVQGTVDQFQPTPGVVARDPQQAAIFGVYALGLGVNTPVEVSQALQVLENLGPAFREDAINAVKNHLQPGQDPMKSIVLMDALVRWGARDTMPIFQRMANDPNPQVRIEAGKAVARMVPPTPASLPGQVPAPAPGLNPMVMNGYLERLKDWKQLPGACYDLAKLPMDQLSPIVQALAKDTSFREDRAFELLTKALATRIREPGAVEAMRAILNIPEKEMRSKELGNAKVRAAIATIYFGTPQDQAGLLKVLTEKYYVSWSQKVVLIKALGTRPDLAATTAGIVTLGAVINDDQTFDAGMAAMRVLSTVKSTLARDQMGESAIWSQLYRAPAERMECLELLAKHPGPYSPRTLENLRFVASRTVEPEHAKKAQELLRKGGG